MPMGLCMHGNAVVPEMMHFYCGCCLCRCYFVLFVDFHVCCDFLCKMSIYWQCVCERSVCVHGCVHWVSLVFLLKCEYGAISSVIIQCNGVCCSNYNLCQFTM